MASNVIERHLAFEGGWHARVLLDSVEYRVGVTRGARVRLAFSTKYGWQWHGYVRDATGHELWKGRVNKSTGVARILRFCQEDAVGLAVQVGCRWLCRS